MDFIVAYAPIFQFVALVFAAVMFFRYFREKSIAAQAVIIIAALYLALIVFKKDPNQFINRFLQGIF